MGDHFYLSIANIESCPKKTLDTNCTTRQFSEIVSTRFEY